MNPPYAGGDRFDNPPSWAIRERVNWAVSPNSRASSAPGQKVWRTIGQQKVLPQRQNAAHLRLDGLLTLGPHHRNGLGS
jgi:hypothetical protein